MSKEKKAAKERRQQGGMKDTLDLMKNFMVQQGFLNQDAEPEQLTKLLEGSTTKNRNDNHSVKRHDKGERCRKGMEVGGEVCQNNSIKSPSEAMIYKDAVHMPKEKNTSNSSDDFINTSDESLDKGDWSMDTLEKSFNLLNHISGAIFAGHSSQS